MKTTAQKFTVKTNYGWGWSITHAPECPRFGSQEQASRYAELRNQGINHSAAFAQVAKEIGGQTR